MAAKKGNKVTTRGERNCDWIEKFCRVPEGSLTGQPVKLRDWQKDNIKAIYDNPAGTRRAIISFGRKNGKGLALDTPIPTPKGWVVMGDLRPGDYVYGSDGTPTKVEFVSPSHTGLRCWRLTFSDGSTIVADEQHRWLTKHSYRPWAKARVNGSGYGGRWIEEVVTTPQIAESVNRRNNRGITEYNHKITVAPEIVSDNVDLPIDPYVLGVWLGDGTSSSSTITCGFDDVDHTTKQLESSGYKVNARKGKTAWCLKLAGDIENRSGLQSDLRSIGVLRNKHIPDSYLNSGSDQRWSLLQGLMDSDGTVSMNGGKYPRASFSGTNESLCRGVWRLARSLGLKATIREGEAKLYGKFISKCWNVSFHASKDKPVFRMARKQDRLPESTGKRSKIVSIVSCEEVDSVPTVCIKVSAENSLFLAGHGCIPTHNTALSAFLLLLHLCGPEAKPNSQLFSAAMSRDQAAILFALAAKTVRMSPDLSSVVTIRDTAKQLACQELGTLYRALSAEASTALGLSASFIVHDELGQVRGPHSGLYEALETSTGAQSSPLSVIISTQAPNPTDLLSVLIDDAKTGADPRVVLSLYSAPEDADPFAEETIRLANPAFGDFQNAEEVMSMANDAMRMPSREPEFRNLVLNQRIEIFAPFVSRSVWSSCGDKVAARFTGPVYGGLDLSSVNDLTAKVYISMVNEKWHVKPTFWLPGVGLAEKSRADRVPYDLWEKQGHLNTTPGKTVDYEFVAANLYQDCQNMDVRKIAFDRWNWRHLKPWLLNAGFKEEQLEGDDSIFEEFGQGFQSMSPALRELEADLLNERIAHENHPVLTMCASNAVVTTNPAGGRKLDKAKATGRIDGLQALAMARAVAGTYEGIKPEPKYQMLILG